MQDKQISKLMLTALLICMTTALVLVGLSSGTTQAIGPGEFVVVDSTGKQLGILVDHDAPHKAAVALQYQGNWYSIACTPAT